ncbi:MAG: SurA N-terminal domain-containing protein [Alphaproteobacteria bacterium]|nr:SurA N-terminal domain-containing protein [Alphaproteobacteria bacterium]
MGFFKARHLLIPAVALVLSACNFNFGGSKPKVPTGQVVATVGGHEITVRQLNAELSGAAPAAPAAQKEQKRAALNFMIERTVLADEARKQGIDKDPDFIMLSQRTMDALLAQQLQAKVAATVPAITLDEATRFENANPNIFAERKIFEVDQIRMNQPSDRTILAKLQPLKTLDEVVNLLTESKIPFQRGTTALDAVGQNPKLIDAIVALPPQEVFVFPAGNQIMINQVKNVRTEPFTGDPANKYAMNVLRLERTQTAVQRQMAAILAKAKNTIVVSKDYAPPKAAPAPAAAATAKTGG